MGEELTCQVLSEELGSCVDDEPRGTAKAARLAGGLIGAEARRASLEESEDVRAEIMAEGIDQMEFTGC